MLIGNLVYVIISFSNDCFSQSYFGVIDIQSIDIWVSGKFGEWIILGGVSEQNQVDQCGFVCCYLIQGCDDISLCLKVEIFD